MLCAKPVHGEGALWEAPGERTIGPLAERDPPGSGSGEEVYPIPVQLVNTLFSPAYEDWLKDTDARCGRDRTERAAAAAEVMHQALTDGIHGDVESYEGGDV